MDLSVVIPMTMNKFLIQQSIKRDDLIKIIMNTKGFIMKTDFFDVNKKILSNVDKIKEKIPNLVDLT